MRPRPSLLPKLAQCPRYESTEFAGAAADRGTAMDSAFRAILSGAHVGWTPEADPDDIAAVKWAVDTSRVLAGGSPLEAREEFLRADSGIAAEGTADLLCADRLWSADLKSGQVRDYEAQQAAYALGFMDQYFVDSWTVYLLFCDERQVVKHEFSRDGASGLTRSIVAAFNDPFAAPTPCDYCDWCAKRWKCPQKLEAVAWFLGIDPANIDLTTYATDPLKVGPLLDLTHAISKDDGVHDMLRAGALGLILGGELVPGWRAQAGRVTSTVEPAKLTELGIPIPASLLPKLSLSRAESICAAGGRELPADIIETNHGQAFLAKTKATKPKKTKA